MNKLKILVLGVGGNVSIGILKAIRNSDINAYIYGACVQKYAAGYAFCDEAFICPYARDEKFISWLIKTIEFNNIDVVLSGVEEINYVLASNDIESNCKILVPEKHNLEVFNDKLQTVKWLKSNGIDSPITLDLSLDYSFFYIKDHLSIPFIVKPKCGKSSAGLFVIEDEDQYVKIENKELYIAQEVIGNRESEYTCGIYKSIFGYTEIIIMRRYLRNGSTVMAEVIDSEKIYNYCKKIADSCSTCVPFNIQLRLSSQSKQPYCFEINMRLSGTTAIRHGFGFKDCQVWLKESIENKNYHNEFNVIPAVALRYEDEVFIEKSVITSLNQVDPTITKVK